jgi:hypothetical protein
MIEAQRRAYLEAMDISVWVGKPGAEEPAGLIVGPGSGNMLLLCQDSQEASTALSADICRYLGGTPVWSWPDNEQRQDYPSIKQAIDQGLFTRLVVFGPELAARQFKGKTLRTISSARVITAPSMDEIIASADARKQLWLLLSDRDSTGGQ